MKDVISKHEGIDSLTLFIPRLSIDLCWGQSLRGLTLQPPSIRARLYVLLVIPIR
jgi:hypothetical protein